MKKTFVNTLNKGTVYHADFNGLHYVSEGHGFFLADTLEELDPARIAPEAWDPEKSNNPAQVLKQTAAALEYGELIPVYNLGTVTVAGSKTIIVEDEAKERHAAYGLKLTGYIDHFNKSDLYIWIPEECRGKEYNPHAAWLVSVYDGIISGLLLPVNAGPAEKLEAFAEQAAANYKAEYEAKEAKKAADREKKKAFKAALEAAKAAQDQTTEQAPAADQTTENPQPENVAEQAAEQAAEDPQPVREYVYYLPYRGVSIGTQPAGFTRFEDMDKTATGFYGAVWYDHALSPEEVANYELTPAEEAPEPEKTEAPEKAEEEKPEKSRKGEKTDPKDVMTAEEAAAAMAGDDWKLTASMLMGWTMRNNNLIMQAALEADLLIPAAVVDFIFNGKMPHFHTFNEWKNHGYIVKRGEKAKFTAKIWKYHTAERTITEEEAAAMAAIMEGGAAAGDVIEYGDYVFKTSYFFTLDQVQKIERGSVTLPEDCKKEVKDGREIISGNTRPIKEQLKAAGYQWHRKNAYWYRAADQGNDTAAA